VKINGERRYLWRAVDYEGEVLESLVAKTRDKTASLSLLRRVRTYLTAPEAHLIDVHHLAA
jgi:putative transposase